MSKENEHVQRDPVLAEHKLSSAFTDKRGTAWHDFGRVDRTPWRTLGTVLDRTPAIAS